MELADLVSEYLRGLDHWVEPTDGDLWQDLRADKLSRAKEFLPVDLAAVRQMTYERLDKIKGDRAKEVAKAKEERRGYDRKRKGRRENPPTAGSSSSGEN